jgi:tetratricopeptide (TPR) repeat protein
VDVLVEAQLLLIRAIVNRQRGDLAASVEHALRALELSEQQDAAGLKEARLLRGVCNYHLGETYRVMGSLEDAAAAFSRALDDLFISSRVAASTAIYLLSEIRQSQGRLEQAWETCSRGLQYIVSQPDPDLPPFAMIHIAAAGILCERNELEEARRHLQTAFELGKGQMGVVRTGSDIQRRLMWAQGERRGVLPLYDAAEKAVRRVEAPYLLAEVRAARAAVQVQLGDTQAAVQWAGNAGLWPGPHTLRGRPTMESDLRSLGC